MKRVFSWMYTLASTDESGVLCLVKAFSFFSAFMWINVLTVLELLLDICPFTDKLSDILFAFSIPAVFVYNYFTILYKSRYKDIVIKYNQPLVKSLVYFILYILFTIATLIIATSFRHGQ